MKFILATIAAAATLTAAAFSVQTYPGAQGEFTLGTTGGKLTAVQVYAPDNGSINLYSVYSADLYTNAVSIKSTTSTEVTAVFSNLFNAAISTQVYNSVNIHIPYGRSLLSSNIVTSTTAVTNTWPVYEKTVATTNAIITNVTASATLYSGAPAADTYLAPGEHMIFTGTATGGFLRLILE